jgi:RNA polymerase sigma-70 factor (TIGR02960 family)
MTPTTEHEFAQHVNRHKRELHVHCYRMLGSFEEAEDLVQETFLRAWRHREQFDDAAGGGHFRAWLYRIATNACLDHIRRKGRRAEEVSSYAEIPWLQPYPDRLLDEVAPRAEEPDAVLVARETIELGFLALIQILPARQRAVLILRDVLEFSAQETADALETSVASVNSALQRARATLGDRAPERGEWSVDAELSEQERELLQGFIDTHESGDAEAAVKLMAEDIRVTMPPLSMVYDGIESLRPLWARAFERENAGEWRLLPTRLNRMPAAASYHRAPGALEFTPFKIDVLRVRDGKIAEVTTFGTAVFAELGLPAAL